MNDTAVSQSFPSERVLKLCGTNLQATGGVWRSSCSLGQLVIL